MLRYYGTAVWERPLWEGYFMMNSVSYPGRVSRLDFRLEIFPPHTQLHSKSSSYRTSQKRTRQVLETAITPHAHTQTEVVSGS